jgi:hypothetical protein
MSIFSKILTDVGNVGNSVEKVNMDPLTAAMQAFTAFNTFLVTPAGQVLAANSETIIANLLDKFNVHLESGPASAAKTTVAVVPTGGAH